MDCTSSPIACKLEEIARAIEGAEWSNFWPTLLATLVGAIIAGGVSIGLYRHEKNLRKRGEIDSSVLELIREVQTYSQSYEKFLRYLEDWKHAEHRRLLTNGPATGFTHPGAPAREGIDTAVEMLVVLTKGDDRRVAERTRQVLYELTFIEDSSAQRLEYGAVRRVLVAWRAQKRTTKETLANLDIVDRRRKMLESGTTENLPPAPEPYERDGDA